jgi:hypothetical protein
MPAPGALGQRSLAHSQDVIADLIEKRRSMVPAQNMASGMIHLFFAAGGIPGAVTMRSL